MTTMDNLPCPDQNGCWVHSATQLKAQRNLNVVQQTPRGALLCSPLWDMP